MAEGSLSIIIKKHINEVVGSTIYIKMNSMVVSEREKIKIKRHLYVRI